jgi:3',5'-cyclic-nucleotide phosphodiesterase
MNGAIPLKEAFQIVVLGCSGGPCENNISSYLLSPLENQEWIALDGGTLLGGIECALKKNSLKGVPFNDPKLTPAAEMLIRHIRAFLISHAHLDHIAGLVLNSQIDENKYILGIDPTLDNIRDHIFNGKIWPNYGSEGVEPILHRYEYVRLPLHKPSDIPNTSMRVEAYLLSHPQGYPSSAFLIEYRGRYLLYFGDTSSDFLELEKHLFRIWRRITPLLKEKKLHGMLLECSFSQKEADQVLFGHLDTKLMMKELHSLAQISELSLEGFTVMVTHRKESLRKGVDSKEVIKEELSEMNDLGINFLFPEQGERYTL